MFLFPEVKRAVPSSDSGLCRPSWQWDWKPFMPLQVPDTPLADTAEPAQGTQLSCGWGRKTLLPKVRRTWESTGRPGGPPPAEKTMLRP